MNQSISQQEQQLQALITEAAGKLAGLEEELRAREADLAACLGEQARYQALEETCKVLEKLRGAGGDALFRGATGVDPELQRQQLSQLVLSFREKVAVLEQARNRVRAGIGETKASLDKLQKQLAGLRRKIAQPEMYDMQGRIMPYRTLPWATRGDDESRFRKLLAAFLCAGLVFGALVPVLRTPVEQGAGIVVPERIARIIKKKQEVKQEEQKLREQAAKKAAEKAAAEKATAEKAKPAEAAPPVAAASPADAEVARRRKSAETKGVLAFKSDLANLLDDSPLPKMGSDARISVKPGQGGGSRSIIVSQSDGSGGGGGGRLSQAALASQSVTGSGGINAVELNRQIGGGTGQRIAESEVKIARVESSTIAAAPSADRPLSSGSGPSRTDEEIQVVFDRYKAALYRMYNKELRVNAGLRGKLVLQITIDPDGKVSQCIVKTDEMGAPGFTAEIVNRVKAFNFGPKEGAPAVTILYPIEFLPPS